MPSGNGFFSKSDIDSFFELVQQKFPRKNLFQLFLSHTAAHRELAEQISDRLSELGVDAFVAHSTITPTAEWQQVIETSLRSCDAMAALITPDFKSSQYCDQEVGFALARGLLVIPVRQGADPHGFLANQQGLPGDTSRSAGLLLADRIYDTLLNNRRTEAKMAPVLVYRYATSRSMVEAVFNLRCVRHIEREHWTPGMIEMLELAERENPYVQETYKPGVDVAGMAKTGYEKIRQEEEPGTPA